MRRIKWVLTVAAVMAVLTVLSAAPTWAQNLDNDCVFAGGDTFCDVEEISAVYDFGDCFFIGNDLFCRVIRFDGFAGGFGVGAVDVHSDFDFDRTDVDLDGVVDELEDTLEDQVDLLDELDEREDELDELEDELELGNLDDRADFVRRFDGIVLLD